MDVVYVWMNVVYVWMDLCSLGLDGCECEYDEIYYITGVYQEEYDVVTGVYQEEYDMNRCICKYEMVEDRPFKRRSMTILFRFIRDSL